jgi:hypothetical protein
MKTLGTSPFLFLPPLFSTIVNNTQSRPPTLTHRCASTLFLHRVNSRRHHTITLFSTHYSDCRSIATLRTKQTSQHNPCKRHLESFEPHLLYPGNIASTQPYHRGLVFQLAAMQPTLD